MAKPTRRIGRERPEAHDSNDEAPRVIGSVLGPKSVPVAKLDVSLEEMLRLQETAEEPAQAIPSVPSPAAPMPANINAEPNSTGSTEIPVSLIDRSPYQPRLLFDERKIDEIAQSIAVVGLNKPILVRPMGDRYELIGGERRLTAFKYLQRDVIPAYVVDMDDAQAERMALADNEGAVELTDYEKGRAYARILQKGIERSQAALSRMLGISEPTVSRCLSYLKLPAAALSLLDKSPELVGTRLIQKFVEVAGANEDVAVQAIAMIEEQGITQEAALRWAHQKLSQSAGSTRQQTEARTISAAGRDIGQMKVSNRAVTITLSKGVDALKVAEAIERYLAESSGEL